MRIAGDAELHARVDRGACVLRAQIEALRVRVDLEEGAGAGARGDQRLDVDVVGFAAIEQAPGRMRDHVDVRMLDRGDHAGRHLLAVLAAHAMGRGNNPVELGQHFVG